MTDDIANTQKNAEDWARDATDSIVKRQERAKDRRGEIVWRLRIKNGMMIGDPNIFSDAIAEIDRLRKVLSYLVEYLAEADEEGLIEHAEPMQIARKVLAGIPQETYRCTKGQDRCSEMYAGPECPYCEIIS